MAAQLILIDHTRPSTPKPPAPKSEHDIAADRYVAERPEVFGLFIGIAREKVAAARAAGERPRLSAKLIAEQVRERMKTEINNNHIARFAQLAMDGFPEFKGLFKQRGPK